MKYNLQRIMARAWEFFRKMKISFSEALHRSWISEKAKEINEERIRLAKAAAGITEPVNTWSAWKAVGRMVSHGNKAVFGCDLIHGSKGDGAIYKARFFSFSQTEPIETVE